MFTTNKFQGFEIREFEIIDSTQEEAKRIIKTESQNNFIIDNIVITSLKQTAGRGRAGKEWISDEGNLFFSLVINSKRVTPPAITSYIAGLSVFNAVNNLVPATAVKWPNDVLVDGKKLSGILLEKFSDYLIIGIGININSSPEYLDSGRKACHLNSYVDKIDVKKLFYQILDNFEKIISEYNNGGFENIKNNYKQNLYKLNEEIKLDYIGRKIKGVIRDISSEGNLVLENEHGCTEYAIGEIFDLY